MSFIIRKRAEDLAREAVGHGDVRPPNQCALGVVYKTIHGAGVNLANCRSKAKQQKKRSRFVHVDSSPMPSLDGGSCVRNDRTGIPWFPVLDGKRLRRFQEFYKTKPRKSTGRQPNP